MRNMFFVLRILLGLATLGSGFYALTKQIELSGRAPLAALDPDDDPRFDAVRGVRLWQAIGQQNEPLVSEYRAAKTQYSAELSAEQSILSDIEDIRDEMAGTATFLGLLLAFACLPWVRWISRSTSAAGEALSATVGAVRARIDSEGASIIGHEKLMRFSVADEMIKWKTLLDQGVVTEAEFNEARRKLLNRADEPQG